MTPKETTVTDDRIQAQMDDVIATAARWEQIEIELSAELQRFGTWMMEKFPREPGNVYHRPTAWRLYEPLRDGWAGLDYEAPVRDDCYLFTDSGGDRYRLPIAWLRDPEPFHQELLTQVHAMERENEGEERAKRAARAVQLRAELAQLEAE